MSLSAPLRITLSANRTRIACSCAIVDSLSSAPLELDEAARSAALFLYHNETPTEEPRSKSENKEKSCFSGSEPKTSALFWAILMILTYRNASIGQA